MIRFRRIKVLLHVSHRNLGDLTENNNVFWSDLYESYRKMIENIHDLFIWLTYGKPQR